MLLFACALCDAVLSLVVPSLAFAFASARAVAGKSVCGCRDG